MKNILLLTDFSDPSKNAISYALKLFENEKCSFHILFIQDSSSYITDDLASNVSLSLYDSLVNKNRLKLIDYVAELESEFNTKNFSFKVAVDFDSIIGAIKQSVKTKNIDLIVMGTNGATGAKEVVFGSNTQSVIRKVTCTTLIIPQEYRYQEPKEMVLALNPTNKLEGKPIDEIFKFLKSHHLELHVLRFNSETEPHDFGAADNKVLSGYMKGQKYQYHLIEHIPMEHAVGTYLQTNPIDIVSLIAEHQSFLDRLFEGSSTTEINKHAEFPLLVFHV